MNVRRGLRRTWIAAAGLWAAVWFLAAIAFQEADLFLFAFLPPIGIAGLGLVVEWVVRGFQDDAAPQP